MDIVNQKPDTSIIDTIFELFSRIVCASNYAHTLHFNSKSGGEHLMYEKVYETLDGMIDEFGEVFFMARNIDIPDPLEKSSEYGQGDLGDLLNKMLELINQLCKEETVDESTKAMLSGFGSDIERCMGFLRQAQFDSNNGEKEKMKISKESIVDLVKEAMQEAKLADDEIQECGAACGAGTTTADLGPAVQYLGDKKKSKGESSECEETLTEDDLEEMSRGILTPQEVVKREYNIAHTGNKDKPYGTANAFVKKVLNNPDDEEHSKWVERFKEVFRSQNGYTPSDMAFASEYKTKNGKNFRKSAEQDYLANLMDHRKNYGKAYYSTGGGMNNYGRQVIKKNGSVLDNPWGKPIERLAQGGIPEVPAQQNKPAATSRAAKMLPFAIKLISDYDSAVDETGDYKKSSSLLRKALNSKEFNALNDKDKQLALSQILNDITGADLTGEDAEFVRQKKMQITSSRDEI